MEFSAAREWFRYHRGYVYSVFFAGMAVVDYVTGSTPWLIIDAVLVVFLPWLYQCPSGLFYVGRKPVGDWLTTSKVLTFEGGETALLRKGVEPVETPSDDPIAVHVQGCEICAAWKAARFDKKKEGRA